MLTNLRRYPEEVDIVLVAPKDGLCPECSRAGLDRRPGSTMKTASVMPREFEGLSRKPMAEVPRISMVPSATLRPASPDAVRVSRVLSSMYNPAASRVPQSKAPSVRPSHAPTYTSQAPRQSQVPSGSKYPDNSQAPSASQYRRESKVPSSSQAPSPSQLPRESRQPSKYPSSAKPATKVHNPISKIPEEGEKRALTPAELLRRGPPKNVAPSAFYNNADGDDARARLGSATVAPNHTGVSTRPSAMPKVKAKTSAPVEYARMQGPSSDAPGPDLDELMSNASITPSASQYPVSQRPAGQTGFPGQGMASQAAVAASKVPASARPSTRPSASTAPNSASRVPEHSRASEAPRHSQMPSQSRAPSASSAPRQSQVPSSTSTRPSARPSPSTAPNTASRAPEHSSTSRPSASVRPTAPPSYHTQASPQSAMPSNAPLPQQGGSRSVAPSSCAPRSTAPRAGGRGADGRQVSSVPEEDEGRGH